MTQSTPMSRNTSLISRNTCKESQNPLPTKTYSVGFKNDAELLNKKGGQKIKPLWIYFM